MHAVERFSLEEPTPYLFEAEDFAESVRRGLGARPKSLPARFFYDEAGSRLFEKICELPEYYLTRVETGILRRHAAEMVGPEITTLIELGSGSARKTRLLLDAAGARERPLTYLPVDISRTALESMARGLLAEYPLLRIRAICASYEKAFGLLNAEAPALVLFLGSNIGNFNAGEAQAFFDALRAYPLLVGFDLVKDRSVLHAAYNDSAGVTAQFNLNLLRRINRELRGEFDLGRFEHRAFFQEAESRIEMHLIAREPQEVRIRDLSMIVRFEAGETIHTEDSYKFTREEIGRLAAAAGRRVEGWWSDEAAWFGVAKLSEKRF